MRVLVALALSLLVAAPDAAVAQLDVGVEDDPVFVRLPTSYGGVGSRGEISARLGYERLEQLGAKILRIRVDWAAVEPRRARTYEDWSRYDAAVASARRAGLSVQLVLAGPAPAFATANHRAGNYNPSPSAFARFAAAAAHRYQGQVSAYSLWSEPNWWSSLKPNPRAPVLYRALYRAGYAAIRRVDPAAAVLIGELAPIGIRGSSIAPLRFLRELVCRSRAMRPLGKCPALVGDGFSLHPYTLRWPPRYPGPGSDDVTTGSLSRLVRALARIARVGALSTPSGGPPPLYLTEYGWSPKYLPTEARRAAMATAALRIIARQPQVREVIWYELAAPPPHRPPLWNTALLTRRGERTPVFNAVRAWIAGGAATASAAALRR